jgi:hypothetical protein
MVYANVKILVPFTELFRHTTYNGSERYIALRDLVTRTIKYTYTKLLII